jgi:hypothetical protein
VKSLETQLRAYRCLYWANQGLLQAENVLKELEQEPASSGEKETLRRTQAMIEETRRLMNRKMSEWVDEL